VFNLFMSVAPVESFMYKVLPEGTFSIFVLLLFALMKHCAGFQTLCISNPLHLYPSVEAE
jgi:hypothetical protein